jgi:hypothetical protein
MFPFFWGRVNPRPELTNERFLEEKKLGETQNDTLPG